MCVHDAPLAQEGVVSSAMPRLFPADAGILAAKSSNFLSSALGGQL